MLNKVYTKMVIDTTVYTIVLMLFSTEGLNFNILFLVSKWHVSLLLCVLVKFDLLDDEFPMDGADAQYLMLTVLPRCLKVSFRYIGKLCVVVGRALPAKLVWFQSVTLFYLKVILL